MSRPTVSTATAADIAEALLRTEGPKKLSPTQCPSCRKEFLPVRSWQKFCTNACRSAHIRALEAIKKGEFNTAVRMLIEENKELRDEVERLTKEIECISSPSRT
jgi:uncharacterized OB-fold protein